MIHVGVGPDYRLFAIYRSKGSTEGLSAFMGIVHLLDSEWTQVESIKETFLSR